MAIYALIFLYKIIPGNKCFTYLKRFLPKDVVKLLDRLLTLRCRLASYNCEKEFLETCLLRGIYTHKLRKTVRSNKLEETVEVCNKFLRAELTSANETISKIKEEILTLLPQLNLLSFCSLCRYVKMTKTMIQNTKKNCNEKHQRLLQACAPIFPSDMDERIVNLSSYQLSQTERQALCLGLDFAIAPRRAKQLEIDAEFESLFQQLSTFEPTPDDQLSLLRAELVKLSKTYGNARIEKSCLLPCHVDALYKLKKNADVILLRPDKGSGVVVMNIRDYHSKFQRILSDRSKFQVDQHQEDASVKVTKSVSTVLSKLKSRGIITPDLQRRLLPQGAVVPRMYGLPKLHKDGVPLRPIVSMTRSALEPLSKWLADVLKPVESAFTTKCVKDSFELVEKLSVVNVPNTIMASFDVSSLFTNVPIKETIDIIVQEVKQDPALCPIPLDLLKEMLLLCTSNVQFLFNDVFYRQKDGVAMGSSLGPFFANVFMGHIERILSRDIASSCLFYVRYMDDTLAVVRGKSEASKLLTMFNSVHCNLSFTCELESNDCISFLDVLVHRRTDGFLSFSVFRKKTWRGVYMSFHSFVPIAYKRALVRSLFTRAVRLCSPEYLQAELHFLSVSLERNAYPTYFIDKYKVTEYVKKPVEITVSKKPVYLRVPFYGDKTASNLRFRVFKAVSKCFPAAQPVIHFSITRIPLRSPKDRLPASCSSSVVYKFSCDCGAVYYGRTSRCLGVRTREHVPKWLINNASGRSTSAITTHALECDAPRGSLREKFTIVYRARNDRLLRIVEALSIKRYQPILCRQKDHVIDLLLPW